MQGYAGCDYSGLNKNGLSIKSFAAFAITLQAMEWLTGVN